MEDRRDWKLDPKYDPATYRKKYNVTQTLEIVGDDGKVVAVQSGVLSTTAPTIQEAARGIRQTVRTAYGTRFSKA